MKTLKILLLLLVLAPVGVPQHFHEADRAISAPSTGQLWHEPSDIASRDLFYGPGGKQHAPHGTFTFVKEDLKGTNPKVVVQDEQGIIYGVKMGDEARPETVASRLVWAAGYCADENYFVDDLHIQGLPSHLRRGQKYVDHDGSLLNVRMKRYSQGDEKLAGDWSWRDNPYAGTRELNGLRVMMALINNWDLTDENTAIHERTRPGESPERFYLIGDLGSSFGTGDLTWPMRRTRDNLSTYSQSKFIEKTTADYVDFHTPAGPSLFFLGTPREFVHKRHIHWIGRHIPREDARWIGQILLQLSPTQIRDAFRAAGYTPQEIDGFTNAVESRIHALAEL